MLANRDEVQIGKLGLVFLTDPTTGDTRAQPGRSHDPTSLLKRVTPAVARMLGSGAVEGHPCMNEPSHIRDASARSRDDDSLRAELAGLARDFAPVITEL